MTRIIAGKFKGRILKVPKVSSTRPTQAMLREAVFNICQSEIGGARFLDLFAGSGAMGFEALSRGALHSTFVEKNRQALQCIKENAAAFRLKEEISLLPMEAARAVSILAKQGEKFEIIYVDPPYDAPFDAAQAAELIKDNGLLFFEGRYDPKKGQNPPQIKNLQLKDSRRFGIASLFIYQKSG